ncbi:MAG: STT3 domain-containing protein [Methanomicrobiales archaeon]
MLRRDQIIIIGIIITIFCTGFFIRLSSTTLSNIDPEDQDFYRGFDGNPYMYELDSYYHYRLTKNYLDHGYLGDKYINGIEWDSYSYYPPGVPMDYPPLIIFLTAFIYKLINLFSSIPLLTVCFWVPAFFAPLGGVIVYLFVRRFTNDIAGLIAGILAVTARFYLIRTVPGWFDTDIFTLFFPVLVVWFFMEAVHHKNIKKKIFYASISALSLSVFSIAWNGWQYIYYLILFFTIIYIIWKYFKGKNIKECLIVLTIFSAGSLLLILLFTGYINFLKPFYGLLELFNIIGVKNPWSPWPDLYLTISELQRPSIEEVIMRIGLILISTSIIGCLLIGRIMFNKEMKKHYVRKMSWFFCLFLISWIILGFFTLLKGARFIILLIPPLTISSGIGIGIMIKYLENFIKSRRLITISCIFLVLILVIPQILTAQDSIKIMKPGVNDDLWESAEWIRTNTPNNTVIITDWSYGHFLTAKSERPVTLDGRSAYIETLPIRKFYGENLTFNGKIPNTSREYWISKGFSTTNETLALGIFRMLSTSGDNTYLILNTYTNNTAKSVEILNDILGIDKNHAAELLSTKYNFTDFQINNLLNYTHPTKSSPFVILTYEKMIGTGYSNFNLGEWDFKNEKMGNFTYSVGDIQHNNGFLNSSNDIVFNRGNNRIKWKNRVPYCLIEVENGISKKKYFDEDSNFCIIIEYDYNKTVVIDKKFENSLFTKLVLQKSNTYCFKKIYENKKVVLWKPTSC